MRIKKNITFGIIVFILTALFGLWFHQQHAQLQRRQRCWVKLQGLLTREVRGFHGTTSVIVKDLRYQWEIIGNPDMLFPAASVIKIPLMAAAFQAQEEGVLSFNETITLQDSYKVSGAGVLKDLPAGSTISLEQLIALMITQSDNTATNLLIRRLGSDYVNAFCKQQGLRATSLTREMMDFRGRKRGVDNFTTARDMATILEKLYRAQLVSPTVSKRCLSLLMQQHSNDRIPALLPAGTMVAHKTGLERNVCHDVGIVYARKGNFLICVFTKDATSFKAAKQFIARLALYAFQCLQ